MRFLAPFLRKGELTDTTRALYIGTQRILLVLLHDFPEFLSQAYYALGDAIPPSCIQLHNLVLSAFPVDAGIRLPDPLQPALKLELLPETQLAPPFLTDYTIALSTGNLRASIDQYLSTQQPSSFVSTFKDRLALSGAAEKSERDPKFNVPLINSLVLYCGVVALNASKSKTGAVKYETQSESAKLLRQLIQEVEPEGRLASSTSSSDPQLTLDRLLAARYYILSACANHLRYPSSHTYWFSSFLLDTFGETSTEAVREQMVSCILS